MDNKVLPFRKKQNARDKSTTDLKVAASGTLAFVILLMVAFNFSFFQSQKDQQNKFERGLASVMKNQSTEIKRDLAQLNQKMIAESAQRPSSIDSLNFGLLEGKYNLQIQSGRVQQIRFLKDASQSPSEIKDRYGFIQNNSQALAPGLKSVLKTSSTVANEGQIVETFKVSSAHGDSTFEFRLDDQQRLLSLEVK